MIRKYLPASLAVVLDALIIAVACAPVALAWWLATGAGGKYLDALSNALFFAGAIVLALGAFAEFFKVKEGRRQIYAAVNAPLRLLSGHKMDGGTDQAEGDASQAAGWLLIFIGGLLIIMSLAATLEYII